MKFPQLKEAVFIKRISRFSADVLVEGQKARVYVPNSGRMKELLLEGAKVYVAPIDKEERLTGYDLILAEYQGTLVSVDSRVPNLLMAEALSQKSTVFWDKPVGKFKKESTFQRSRFDFKVTFQGAQRGEPREGYVETKSVTLVQKGVAMFPDAPSERGSKHLLELIEAVKQGFSATALFIIQRRDAAQFTPNEKTDPEFAANLWKAKEEGVEIMAFNCIVKRDEIVLGQKLSLVGG